MAERSIVRELVTLLGFDIDDKTAATYERRIRTLKTHLRSATIAAGVFGAAIGLVTRAVAKEGAEIYETARALGFSTEALQEWRFAAQSAGVALGLMDSSLRSFSRRVGLAATRGMGPAVHAIAMLELQLRDANGHIRDMDTLLTEAFAALSKLEDQQKRNAIAADLFNLSGLEMNKMLQNGIDGLMELRRRAHEVGAVMDEELTKESKKTTQAWLEFWSTIKSIRNELAREFLPKATAAVGRWRKWISENKQLLVGLTKLVGVLLGLKVVLALLLALKVALLLILSPIGLIIAGLAALVILAQDVYVAIKGEGRSFTGAAIKGIGELVMRKLTEIKTWVTDLVLTYVPDKIIAGLTIAWTWLSDHVNSLLTFIYERLNRIAEEIFPAWILDLLQTEQARKVRERGELAPVGLVPGVDFVPAAAAAVPGATTTVTFSIVAAPGQSPTEIAREVARLSRTRLPHSGSALTGLGK